jgi:hypothetical protein
MSSDDSDFDKTIELTRERIRAIEEKALRKISRNMLPGTNKALFKMRGVPPEKRILTILDRMAEVHSLIDEDNRTAWLSGKETFADRKHRRELHDLYLLLTMLDGLLRPACEAEIKRRDP